MFIFFVLFFFSKQIRDFRLQKLHIICNHLDVHCGPFVNQQTAGRNTYLTFRSLTDDGFETAIQAIARLSEVESVKIVNETLIDDQNDQDDQDDRNVRIFNAFKDCSELKSLVAVHRGNKYKLIDRH